MLKIGASGSTVRDLQESLNTAIPLQPLLALDGNFGPKTNQRVLAFQKQAGLTADGIVGPMTGEALVAAVITVLRG